MEIESYRDTNPDTQAVPSKAWVLFAVARMSRRFKLIFWCFNATFNNISAISWRPVLAVEEAGVLGENHRPWATGKFYLPLLSPSFPSFPLPLPLPLLSHSFPSLLPLPFPFPMFHPKNTTLFPPFAPLFRVPVIYLLVLLGLNFKSINITSISENWICNLTLKTLSKLPFSSLCPYVREGKGRGRGKGREGKGEGCEKGMG